MRRSIHNKIFIAAMAGLLSLFCYNTAFAQPAATGPKTDRILFLFDCSGSMDNQWLTGGGTKMDAAKKTLTEEIDKLKLRSNLEIALRVFGTQSPSKQNDCSDTKLLVPFGKANIPYIKDAINTVKANGVTPIALSLQKAAGDFPQDPDARNIIIMITDGEESCGGDPCAVSLALQKSRVFLRPFIIALNNEMGMLKAFECMGNFFQAVNPDIFRSTLDEVVSQALNPTYVQVNLLDVNGKASETDVDMSFNDYYTHLNEYNYYHTITYHGIPDTENVDPVRKYDLVVHTIPEIVKEKIDLKPNQVNVINVPAPQGFLTVKMQSATIDNNINNKIRCIVREHNKTETLNLQKMNSSDKYLCGKYDLEFLTLPRTQIPGVDISESETTTIQIPSPGLVAVNKGYPVVGGLFYFHNNEWQSLYEFNQNTGNESIALQPGTYRIIYRSKSVLKTADTKTQTITVVSGQNSSVTL